MSDAPGKEAKAPYFPPTLVEFGKVRDLTGGPHWTRQVDDYFWPTYDWYNPGS